MEKQLIMLSSITYAYKARDFLSKQGISSFIERTPEELKKKGCSYSLSVRGDAEEIVKLLKNAGFQVLGVI